jgi:hypothetical protein
MTLQKIKDMFAVGQKWAVRANTSKLRYASTKAI